jgi:hypothetical protein
MHRGGQQSKQQQEGSPEIGSSSLRCRCADIGELYNRRSEKNMTNNARRNN